MPKAEPLEQRFWRHVTKTSTCWLWQGAGIGSGYGVTNRSREQKSYYAHRAAYEMTFGPIPPGLFVLHRCDVRLCVRPDHLFVGTAADNTHDMMQKGRGIIGENKTEAVLRDSVVRQIRRLNENGMAPTAIGRELGFPRGTIRAVLEGRTWKHVT